jgi:hypothetical protein
MDAENFTGVKEIMSDHVSDKKDDASSTENPAVGTRALYISLTDTQPQA